MVLVFQQNTWGSGGQGLRQRESCRCGDGWQQIFWSNLLWFSLFHSRFSSSTFHILQAPRTLLWSHMPLVLLYFRVSYCTQECSCTFFFQWIASINYSLFRKVDEKLKLERSQSSLSWLWTWPHISSADCLKAVLALHTQCLMLQNHSIEVCQLKTSLHFFISWWSSLSS